MPSVDGAEFNPFDRGFDDIIKMQGPEVLANTRRNSGSGSAVPALPIPEPRGGVPANPFSRTLATMEPGTASVPLQEAQKGPAAQKDGAMGVDDFAKMLLTGKGPSTAAEVPAASVGSQKAPRDLSSDEDDSETSSSEDDDDYEARRGNAATTTKGKQKPPPPKHRHGKSVSTVPANTERTPQTVSFDDFDGFPPPAAATAAATTRPSSGKALPQPPPLSRRTTSDFGNPPPSTPTSTTSRATTTDPESTTTTNTATRSRSSSLREPAPPPDTTSSTSKPGKPPPPPPTRRAGTRSSASAAPDTPDAPPQVATPSDDPTSGTAPRRALATALQQDSSSRSSSQSGQARDRPTPMAPPPPPRRRGSSKGSMDLQAASRRASGDSARQTTGGPRGSVESERQVAAGGVPEEGDVLANLEALQAEVDALRSRYRKTS